MRRFYSPARSVRLRADAHVEVARKHKPDYLLVLLALFLLVAGLTVVYAISPGISAARGVSEGYYITKQLIAAGLGVVAFFITANLPVSLWQKLRIPLIIAAAILAILVFAVGEEVNGAQRWLQIGGISFQAAELTKFALLIWLATFLSGHARSGTLTDLHGAIKPLVIALGIVGLVVAGLESDLGSAAVMTAMMLAMVFMAGMPMRKVILALLVVALLGSLFIVTSGYRRQRVATFLNPEQDCQNTGYQICESLKAIGSGGMFGKGLGKSVQAYGYLPEAANDSIFAIFAEKFGFLGVGLLLGVFLALFGRIKRILERTKDVYARLLIAGVLAWFAVQTIINIGAMIGMLPLKGITLPFISTGGTSLLFVSAALGIVFQLSRTTTFAPLKDTDFAEDDDSVPSVLRRPVMAAPRLRRNI